MNIAHRYTLPGRFFACSVSFGSVQPGNSSTDPLPPKPWINKWPQYAEGAGWKLVEDHRERNASNGFAPEDVQEATEYWLPAPLGDDDWQSQPRTMNEPGPLPTGHCLTRPEKPLNVAQEEKRGEIIAAHAEVLAFMLAERPNPTPVEAALAVQDMGIDDPEGLSYARQLADSRRDELLAAVDAAKIPSDVAVITVTYQV